MAVKQRSDKYWADRATQRVDLVEADLPKRRRALRGIYLSAEKQVMADIMALYGKYYSTKGVDLDALTSKLSLLETRRFWKKLRQKGMRGYVASNYRYRISRLEKELAEIYVKIHEVIDEKELAVHTASHVNTYNIGFNRSVYDLAVATNTNLAFGGINSKLLDTTLNQRWLGSNYSARIWGKTDILANTLSSLLGQQMLTGQSPRKTATIIQARFGVARSYADRLIRTETNFIYSEAEHQVYQQLDVKKYKYVATLDNRTSKICQSLDGKLFLVSKRKVGTNCNPMHPYCRSSTRPFLGDNYEPETRRARDSGGRPIVVENLTYPAWAKIHNIKQVRPVSPPKIQAR